MATSIGTAVSTSSVDPGRWRSLAVVLSASFLVTLDFFVINVSIPSIRADLHASFADLQLVIASYGLTYSVLLITGGRLGDIYGRKRMFLCGITGFTSASLLCGMAPSPGFLIASRAIQGSMAAMLFPQVLSLIQVTNGMTNRAIVPPAGLGSKLICPLWASINALQMASPRPRPVDEPDSAAR